MSSFRKHFLISFSFLLLFPFAAQAGGALFLSPSSGNYKVGDSFSVLVNLDTGGESINASTGHINFDNSKLQVVSLTYAQSVFSIWTEIPAFSNQAGTISFSGGVPSPGYTGSSGTVLRIIFKAKSYGQAPVNFLSGSILANDGKGTNIADGLRGAFFTLTSPFAPVSDEEVTPKKNPTLKEAEKAISAPIVTKWPRQLDEGDTLTMEGLGYPLTKISVIIQKDSEEWVNGYTFSGFDGKFIFTHPNKVEVGYYTIWARNIAEDGNQSGLSDPVITSVVALAYIKVGDLVLYYDTVIIILLVLLILFLLFWILSFFYVRKRKRRKVETEKKALESLNEKDFGMYVAKELGEHINNELSYLKRIQELEKEKGGQEQVVAAALSGIAEKLLEENERAEKAVYVHSIPSMPPSISETAKEQMAAAPSLFRAQEEVSIPTVPVRPKELPKIPIKAKEKEPETVPKNIPPSPSVLEKETPSVAAIPVKKEIPSGVLARKEEKEAPLVSVPNYSEQKTVELQSEPEEKSEEKPQAPERIEKEGASAANAGIGPLPTLSSPHRTETKG